jgi:hypothetical protein
VRAIRGTFVSRVAVEIIVEESSRRGPPSLGRWATSVGHATFAKFQWQERPKTFIVCTLLTFSARYLAVIGFSEIASHSLTATSNRSEGGADPDPYDLLLIVAPDRPGRPHGAEQVPQMAAGIRRAGA